MFLKAVFVTVFIYIKENKNEETENSELYQRNFI